MNKNDNFYNYLNKIKSEIKNIEFDIEKCCLHLKEVYLINAHDLFFLGSGNYGSAFVTLKNEEEKVVKITDDREEIVLAKKLTGYNNQYLADIYGVYDINNKCSIIIQEKLDIESSLLKESRSILLDILDDNNATFPEIVKNEKMEDMTKNGLFIGEWCPKHCFKVIRDAYSAFEELKEKTGSESDDFHLFNMGIKKNGNIGFFDQTIY